MKLPYLSPRYLFLAAGASLAILTQSLIPTRLAFAQLPPAPVRVMDQDVLSTSLSGSSHSALGRVDVPYPQVRIPRNRPRFRLPLAQPTAVTHYFNAPKSLYGPGNRGVDFATTANTQVLAPAAGTITFCGEVAHLPTVSLTHAAGIKTTYQPVKCERKLGEEVAAGAVIGVITSERGAQLHWGAKLSRLEYFDPLLLLQAPTVLVD